MEKKRTQKEMFNEIIALAKASNRTDIVEFATKRIEVLDKKSSNRKPTKAQIESDELAEIVLETMKNVNKPMTVSEIMAADNSGVLATYSNQKISAVLRRMKDNKAVVRVEDGRKTLFELTTDEVE